MTASDFASEFFKRYPKIYRFAPTKFIDKTSSSTGTHPEARQADEAIWLYPKFWDQDDTIRDWVFAHEIGHYVLSKYSLAKLISTLEEQGIDGWDTASLPFGESDMHEAFASCFAEAFLNPEELQRIYPKWERVVSKVVNRTARKGT